MVLIGLCCVGLFGQRSDTIWQQLTNQSVVAGTFQSVNINNIGQTGHTVFVSLTGTCAFPNLVGGFYFSWDNSTYYPFGYQTPQSTNGNTNGVVIATGAYPFIQVRLNYGVDCTPTVFYTGVVANPYTLTQGSIPSGSYVNQAASNSVPAPIVKGFLAAQDTDSAIGFLAPDVEGITTLGVNVPVGTTVKLNQTVSIAATARIYISHLDLSADTNATVITLKEGTDASCGTGSITLGTWVVNAGIPFSIGKIRLQNLADAVCITSAVGTVKGSITYGMLGSTTTVY